MSLAEIAQDLQSSGINNYNQEAAWIVKYAKDSKIDLKEIVRRRSNGEPLQYLLGGWEFYGYEFKVGQGVLIPRPETELLVELAVDRYRKHIFGRFTFLDLCAGTGCVGIALAKKTGCDVIAIEKSSHAIEYLNQNIALNNVENQVQVIQADVLEFAPNSVPLLKKVDCVLINPPYLSEQEMQSLQKEVTYEPKMALYGGKDGLDFYRRFFDTWRKALNRVCLLACEVGDGQAATVCQLMRENGLSPKIKKDFNGIDRIIYSEGETPCPNQKQPNKHRQKQPEKNDRKH